MICRQKWQPTPVLLPGESLGQRSLVGYSPWGCRVGHDWATHTHTHTHRYPGNHRDEQEALQFDKGLNPVFWLCVPRQVSHPPTNDGFPGFSGDEINAMLVLESLVHIHGYLILVSYELNGEHFSRLWVIWLAIHLSQGVKHFKKKQEGVLLNLVFVVWFFLNQKFLGLTRSMRAVLPWKCSCFSL